MTLFFLILAFAGNDDYKEQVRADQQTLKEDALRHAKKQAEYDEKAALYLYNERAK